MFKVSSLLSQYGKGLHLQLETGEKGLSRAIKVPELQRPGLSLSGYLTGKAVNRMLVFGKAEMSYLKSLDPKTRETRIRGIFSKKLPAVFVSRNLRPPSEMKQLCKALHIPLIRSPLRTMELINQLTVLLSEEFAQMTSCHATLVEAFGIGVLIQGDSSVGKSEAALGLIERGHRLISDDIVKVRKKEGGVLEGTGTELTRHLLEIRGIGIINVATLYGAVCISESMRIDMIVKLEVWDDNHFYDRVGLEEKTADLLGVKVPHYVLPVKPGRDIVLLIETTVLNHRLKEMGYNSAKEFNTKLLATIAARSRSKV